MNSGPNEKIMGPKHGVRGKASGRPIAESLSYPLFQVIPANPWTNGPYFLGPEVSPRSIFKTRINEVSDEKNIYTFYFRSDDTPCCRASRQRWTLLCYLSHKPNSMRFIASMVYTWHHRWCAFFAAFTDEPFCTHFRRDLCQSAPPQKLGFRSICGWVIRNDIVRHDRQGLHGVSRWSCLIELDLEGVILVWVAKCCHRVARGWWRQAA